MHQTTFSKFYHTKTHFTALYFSISVCIYLKSMLLTHSRLRNGRQQSLKQLWRNKTNAIKSPKRYITMGVTQIPRSLAHKKTRQHYFSNYFTRINDKYKIMIHINDILLSLTNSTKILNVANITH